jgi:hypothetical protein
VAHDVAIHLQDKGVDLLAVPLTVYISWTGWRPSLEPSISWTGQGVYAPLLDGTQEAGEAAVIILAVFRCGVSRPSPAVVHLLDRLSEAVSVPLEAADGMRHGAQSRSPTPEWGG